ncbi:FIGNL1-interacting regulator of recombination and mitosis-like [Ylistrum balloti]|uniref:FIGNL1-interacting regulator of recombination and mitosis-like n=1 Tax=Ylistrum balloti TaxID=509963 RepID=UPI002905919D|nr:FIGNL1-interacting regulator of recombination and mitosis-like [Ylistrum balloti]
MSQTTFLESVVSWNEEQCQQNLEEALPKLVTYCHDAQGIQEQVGILKIICQSFLPCVDVLEAEWRVYSQIVSKICDTFDNILETVQNLLGQNKQDLDSVQEDILTYLQLLLEIVDCCETCVRFSQSSQVALCWSHVHSLPVGTLHILKGTYSHCKESTDVYGDYLPSVTDPLSLLFRKAHSLQVVFLSLLDKISIDTDSVEEDARDLCYVCHGLFEVCQIVTALDMKLVVNLWKAISRHAGQKKEILRDRLEINNLLIYLCGEIKTGYSYLFQLLPRTDPDGMVLSQGDERGFQKSVKIVGFQMKVLVMMARDYIQSLSEAANAIYRLILHLLRYVQPSVHAIPLQESHSQEIHRHLINATEPLVASLVFNRTFLECLTQSEPELEEEEKFAHLQVLMSVMEQFPKTTEEMKDLCLMDGVSADRDDLLTSVFKAAHQCYVEMLLPVYIPTPVCGGEPQGCVSLYEFLCTRMCGLAGTYSVNRFPVLERVLIQWLLSRSPVCAPLAADVWCFIARYGSADMCYSHITVLLELCQNIKGHNSDLHSILSLVYRLSKFLSPEHQNALVRQFPPCDDLTLWCLLPVTMLPSDRVRDITVSMTSLCLQHMESFINTPDVTCHHTELLICSLTYLINTQTCPKDWGKFIDHQVQSSLVKCVQKLWQDVFVSDWMCIPQTQLCLGKLLQYSGQLVNEFTNSDLLKIFSVMKSCLGQNPSDCLKFSMVDFLKKFGKVKLGADFEQSQVLQKASTVFRELMTDTCCLVHHWSVEAFTHFAEDTVHETVVPDCMAQDNRLEDCVVAYLNKVPFVAQKGSLTSVECIQVLWKQAERHQSSLDDTQPLKKKARTSSPVVGPVKTPNSSLYQEVLDTLRICVQELEQTCTNKSAVAPQGFHPSSIDNAGSTMMTDNDNIHDRLKPSDNKFRDRATASDDKKSRNTATASMDQYRDSRSSVDLSPHLVAHLQLAQHKITSLLTEHG